MKLLLRHGIDWVRSGQICCGKHDFVEIGLSRYTECGSITASLCISHIVALLVMRSCRYSEVSSFKRRQ